MKHTYAIALTILVYTMIACSPGQPITISVPGGSRSVAPDLTAHPHGHFTYQGFKDTAHWKVWKDSTYHPQTDWLPVLQTQLTNYQIRMYVGTWCGDSKEVVPQFFNLLDLVGYDPAGIDYILLNRDRASWVELAGADSIKRVPTILILKDGVETGRITERPIQSLEADLAEILSVSR